MANPKIDNKNAQQILDSIRLSRIILPVILGIGVILFLILRQFDHSEFLEIKWNERVFFFLGCAVVIYMCRHLLYAWRLRILSDYMFSMRKSIELVFIWEFASAISPTSIGGSAVAIFFLAQERISGAKAVSIVLYTVIIDTIFFLISLVFLYVYFGPVLIYPEMENMLGGYGITFSIVWIFMLLYGGLLTYGLFRPKIIQRILFGFSKIPLIRRFQRDLVKIGQDVVVTSRDIRQKTLGFHIKTSLATIGAWVTRFITVNFIILALVNLDITFDSQFLLYARSQTMYVITQFSPTPGGSGVLELLFSGFFSDYIPKGIGSIAAFLWRLITYYPYLIIGAIIIPNWIRVIMLRRQSK